MTRSLSERQESEFSQRLVARLHALAREHREGRLSREAYRKLRAPLLDCLDSRYTAELQSVTLPNQDMRLREAGALALASTLQPATTPASPERRRRLARVLTLAVVTGLLIAAGVAVWWAHERAAAESNRHPVSPPCNSCPA